MKDICAIFLILGSVIGAGFATGKELVVFYVRYGLIGMVGIIISSVLFSIVLYKYLMVGKNAKKQKMFDIIIFVCLIIISGGLIGACGEIGDRLLFFDCNVIGIITVVIVGLLLLYDIDKLSKVCFLIVPVLILITIIICLLGVSNVDISINSFVVDNNIAASILYSISYVGINTMMVSKIIFDMKDVKNKKNVSIASSMLYGIIVLIVSMCLFLSGGDVINSNVPIYVLACRAGDVWQYLYLVSLWFAIVSSLISTIYGIQCSFAVVSNCKIIRIIISLLICYIVSLVGFENIVGVLYPIIGILGVLYYLHQSKNPNV